MDQLMDQCMYNIYIMYIIYMDIYIYIYGLFIVVYQLIYGLLMVVVHINH